jgi:hypothetical protein
VSPVFTRALDYDQPSDINSTGAIPVQSGTVNTTTSWLLTSTVNTVGTDALTYVQFSTNPSATASLPPYFKLNGTLYVPMGGMYQATLPNFTGYAAAGTAPTLTALTNGDYEVSASSGGGFTLQSSLTTSIEAMVSVSSSIGNTTASFGVVVYDTTNSKILGCMTLGNSSQSPSMSRFIWTYSGSGSPSFSSQTGQFYFQGVAPLIKMSISGTTATCSYSLNGGANYFTISSDTVGTIAKTGIFGQSVVADVFSLKLQ